MLTMRGVPIKPGKKQLNLWISDDTNSALEQVAGQLHLRGRTQAAEWIIERYLAAAATKAPRRGNLKVPGDAVAEKKPTQRKTKL